MGTYEDIRAGRRLVIAGVAAGYLLALAAAALFVINLDGQIPGGVWQVAAWLVLLVTPPTWAAMSLDRRPSLLRVATYSAVALTFLTLFGGLLPPVHLVIVILWLLAERRRPGRPVEPTGSTWKRPLLAVAVVIPALLMYAHLDPVCAVTDVGGHTVITADSDAPSGWRLGTSVVSGSSVSSGPETETTTCWSDSIEWWEGLVGLLAAVAVLGIGTRWPANDQIRSTATPAGARSPG